MRSQEKDTIIVYNIVRMRIITTTQTNRIIKLTLKTCLVKFVGQSKCRRSTSSRYRRGVFQTELSDADGTV